MPSDSQHASVATLFSPSSVAVIGASPRRPETCASLRNLLETYPGRLSAVNPNYTEILGVPCAPSVRELAEPPEAVIVNLGRDRVVPALEEAADIGVRAAVVFSGGFAESDDAGRALQDRMVQIAKAADMAVVGPNCMGAISFVHRTPLFIEPVHPYEAGRVGLIAQSGSVAVSCLNNTRGVRWSHVVSTGNEAVTGAVDYLQYMASVEDTAVICVFLETIREPEQFFAACDQANAQGKAVIALKTGRTEAATRAAAAHTGALAVPDRMVDALMSRHSVIRVHSLDEMLQTAIACQSSWQPSSPTIGVAGIGVATIAASGGLIGLVADESEPLGIVHPPLAEQTRTELRQYIPAPMPLSNPLDWWGVPDHQTQLPHLLETLARDPSVDVVVDITDVSEGVVLAEADTSHLDLAARLAQRTDALVVAIDASPAGFSAAQVEEALAAGALALSGLPDGLRALRNLICHRTIRHIPAKPPTSRIKELASRALAGRTGAMSGEAALALLGDLGVPVPAQSTAHSAEDAARHGSKIGFPVALKAADEGLLHKTEIGGVALGLHTADAVLAAAHRMQELGVRKFQVQEMVSPGTELIVGAERHADLGPFVLVGMGGIWTEVLDDVALRPAGLHEGEPEEMLRSLRAFPVMSGARNTPPLPLDRIAHVVQLLDMFVRASEGRVISVDINPLIVTPSDAVAVDALIVLAD